MFFDMCPIKISSFILHTMQTVSIVWTWLLESLQLQYFFIIWMFSFLEPDTAQNVWTARPARVQSCSDLYIIQKWKAQKSCY